jgi:hypothetical protein
MSRVRPDSLNAIPDADLEATICAQIVIHAYTVRMAAARNEREAFDTAVRAWLERNPNASPEEGSRAVATIICHKL